jgi:hypothetical protein
MPQPASSDVHLDQLLTNISVAYMQSQANFVAPKIFPIVPVDKQSDKYRTYTKNDWFRDEAEKRQGATESVGSGYTLSDTAYYCDKYAIHKDIDDDTRRNADSVHDLDKEATEFVSQRLLLRQEIQWAADFFASGIWGTDVTPANLWSSYATSDPILDVEAGKAAILSTTGFMPNTLVLGYDVYRQLRNHPDLIDRIKYTTSQTLTTEMMARLFDIGRVEVAMAVKATNKEGGTAAYAFTHGKHALLAYVPPNPGLMTPSAGYMFAWKGVSGPLEQTVGVKTFRMEQLEADRVEGSIAFDNKIVGADLGYMFVSVVA